MKLTEINNLGDIAAIQLEPALSFNGKPAYQLSIFYFDKSNILENYFEVFFDNSIDKIMSYFIYIH